MQLPHVQFFVLSVFVLSLVSSTVTRKQCSCTRSPKANTTWCQEWDWSKDGINIVEGPSTIRLGQARQMGKVKTLLQSVPTHIGPIWWTQSVSSEHSTVLPRSGDGRCPKINRNQRWRVQQIQHCHRKIGRIFPSQEQCHFRVCLFQSSLPEKRLVCRAIHHRTLLTSGNMQLRRPDQWNAESCIVADILDTALSGRLQMDSKLTLDSAMKQVRQSGAAKDHQRLLQEV